MPAATTRFQITLHTVGGISKDFVTNTWHMHHNDVPSSSDFTAITNAFKTFYGTGISFSANVAATGHVTKLYLLDSPRPRVPLFIGDMGTLSIGPDSAPREIAVCVSGRQNPHSGGNQRKERGRVYLGPLSFGWVTGEVIPSTVLTSLTAKCTALVNTLYAMTNATEVGVVNDPHTPPGAPPTITFTPYNTMWVDNAWDTQRRRGISATSRSTITTPYP